MWFWMVTLFNILLLLILLFLFKDDKDLHPAIILVPFLMYIVLIVLITKFSYDNIKVIDRQEYENVKVEFDSLINDIKTYKIEDGSYFIKLTMDSQEKIFNLYDIKIVKKSDLPYNRFIIETTEFGNDEYIPYKFKNKTKTLELAIDYKTNKDSKE
jgi:hypothetical protein